MKDSNGDLVQGRTRWRRFAAVVVPAAVAAGGLMAGVANGSVPVAMNVSGQSFKISASNLHGDGFSQYGSAYYKKDGTPHAVAAAAIKHAELTNLCQSVVQPLPWGGSVTLVIKAGGSGTPATADNLLIGMDFLGGDATFHSINIGTDASALTKGGTPGSVGMPGAFGQEADSVDITNVKQRAYTTSAGTFALNGLTMQLVPGSAECFPDTDIP
ncbi:DUF6230 family protein [Hamadaea tsunoensis]|uniref:DUF6230 family protein n=1 Tax=Hamadaea tsunoensis TaxID=53368 RepID=UPI00042085EC|nr:DUF6230 family protein [Hamadaea tsunoensis]